MHVMKKGHNENRNEKPHSRRVHKLVKCKSVISCLENLSKEAADEERGAVLWQEGGRGGKWRPLRSTASPSPPMPPPPPVRSNRSPTAEFSVVPPPFPPPPPPPPTDGRPLLALRDIRTPWWWLPIPLRFPYLFCLFFFMQFCYKGASTWKTECHRQREKKSVKMKSESEKVKAGMTLKKTNSYGQDIDWNDINDSSTYNQVGEKKSIELSRLLSWTLPIEASSALANRRSSTHAHSIESAPSSAPSKASHIGGMVDEGWRGGWRRISTASRWSRFALRAGYRFVISNIQGDILQVRESIKTSNFDSEILR